MSFIIENIDMHNLPAQKYWTPPASWTPERKKAEIYNAIFSGEYTGSRKMDGAWYKFIKGTNGEMELLGRSKGVGGDYLNKIEWVPHLHKFFNELPNGTCLIGEIYFPNNEGSNKVTTIMGCLKDKAIARQEKGERLHYYIFDILAWNGKILYKNPIEDRIDNLNALWRAYPSEYVEYAKYFEGAELWNQLQIILAEGGEGVVITKLGTSYQPDKRTAHQTIKVKKELQETIDAVVIGANPPTRIYTGSEILTWKYWENIRTQEKLQGDYYKDYSDGLPIEPVTKNYFLGCCGSWIIGLYDVTKKSYVPIGSVAGLTDEMAANWRDYLGKVYEIGGMELMRDSDGKFTGIRHPKILRSRADKAKEECSIDQVK